MQRFSKGIAVGTLAGLASLFAVAPAGVATAAARGSATTAIAGSQSEAASSTNDLGAVPASTVISFEVTLNPQHAAGAAALVEQNFRTRPEAVGTDGEDRILAELVLA